MRPLSFLAPDPAKVIYLKLSGDEIVRNRQFAEFAAQVSTARTAAVANANRNRDGSQSTDFYDCSGGECFLDPTSYVIEQDIGLDPDNPVLERVVVQGWCKVMINNTEVYCSDAQAHLENLLQQPLERRVAEQKTADALGKLAEIIVDNVEP